MLDVKCCRCFGEHRWLASLICSVNSRPAPTPQPQLWLPEWNFQANEARADSSMNLGTSNFDNIFNIPFFGDDIADGSNIFDEYLDFPFTPTAALPATDAPAPPVHGLSPDLLYGQTGPINFGNTNLLADPLYSGNSWNLPGQQAFAGISGQTGLQQDGARRQALLDTITHLVQLATAM